MFFTDRTCLFLKLEIAPDRPAIHDIPVLPCLKDMTVNAGNRYPDNQPFFASFLSKTIINQLP